MNKNMTTLGRVFDRVNDLSMNETRGVMKHAGSGLYS